MPKTSIPETEKGFQQAVLDLARLKGWLCYHTYDSRRSAPGFPDIMMIRGFWCIVAELKSEKGKATKAQLQWLDAFGVVPGIRAYLWRPSDWDDIVELLS